MSLRGWAAEVSPNTSRRVYVPTGSEPMAERHGKRNREPKSGIVPFVATSHTSMHDSVCHDRPTSDELMGQAPCPSVDLVIVDDNRELAENIAEILEINGHHARIFQSAEEALPVALSPRVSALITDYRLPGMNGIDLIATILRVRSVPAIVMSAYTDDRIQDAARALGAEFFSKPIDIVRLNRLVGHLVGRANLSVASRL